ncbi:tetratricopeptide repeat protein [Planctomycetota bacterium]
MIRKAAQLILATVFMPLLTYGQSRIEKANTHYFNFRTIEAKQIYEQLWRGSNQDEKIAAGKQLAQISWKFYADYERAKKYVDSLLELTEDQFDLLIQMADISIQTEKFENAERYLNRSIECASDDRQIRDSRIKYAEYVLAKSQKNLLSHKLIDTKDVNKAFGFLKDYYLKEPENLNLTKLYLGTVLLLKKDIEIINAWRTYFRIPQNEKAIGLLAKAEGNIRKGLGSNSKDAAVSLVKGLSDSRFFDYAVMMMFQQNLNYKSMADLADIYHYYVFLNDAEGLIYEYYRSKSLGTTSDNKYYKDYYSLCIDFWFTLNWENGKPLFFYEKGFEEELFKRFGSKTFTGKGGDQISFFVGHSVINNSQTIEQYGRQAKITYISLDNIIGNIYPHWYFGFFGVGGWAIENQVIQIRTVPLNNNSPLRAFNRLTNDEERKKWLVQIKDKSIEDDSIVRSNPYAILEGLSERLKYQCYSQILNSMKQLNYDDRELKIHFLFLPR